jgi:hypothetical protein
MNRIFYHAFAGVLVWMAIAQGASGTESIPLRKFSSRKRGWDSESR